jgi:hypothetical protein
MCTCGNLETGSVKPIETISNYNYNTTCTRAGHRTVYFQTKNPNLGKFWRALDSKMLINLMSIWNTLQTFEIFYDNLVHFEIIWYIFYSFGIWQPWSRRSRVRSRVRNFIHFLKRTDNYFCRQNSIPRYKFFRETGRCYDHIFCDFCQFSAKKLAFFPQKPML